MNVGGCSWRQRCSQILGCRRVQSHEDEGCIQELFVKLKRFWICFFSSSWFSSEVHVHRGWRWSCHRDPSMLSSTVTRKHFSFYRRCCLMVDVKEFSPKILDLQRKKSTWLLDRSQALHTVNSMFLYVTNCKAPLHQNKST